MPEKHLRFKVAVAAAIHQRFLQLAADHAAHHIGIGFPAGLQLADLQAEQAVNAAQIGLLPHQFHRSLRRLLLAVQEQRGIEFQAIDANDQPWKTEGNVTVTRQIWTEIWLDSSGREVTGAELYKLQQDPMFPPAPPEFSPTPPKSPDGTRKGLDGEGRARRQGVMRAAGWCDGSLRGHRRRRERRRPP